MAMLSVQMLGRLAIRYNGADIAGLEPRKVQELLCYLLLHRERPHPRESLANTLWSDTPTAQSRANLRKVLWQLQNAFSHLNVAPPLAVEPEWIQALPEAEIWLDVAELEAAAGLAQGEQIGAAEAEAAERAVELYRGELLEGWYQDWCLFERERILSLYLALLDKLMAFYEVHGRFERGLAHGAAMLRYDRARELTHRRLMRLLLLSGDRTGALRQYERCVAILHDELDIGPSEPTLELYDRIKHNRPLEDEQAVGDLSAAQSRMQRLLPQLRQLKREVAAIWQAVEDDIQAIEQLIDPRTR